MKKILAIVLALVLVLGLCACTGNNGGTTPGGDEQANNNQSGTDMSQKVKLSIGIPTNAMVLDHDNNALTKWIEEECNVELTFVEYAGGTDVATQISTTIAARQDLPDILFGISLSDSVITRYGKDGYLLDLTEYYADKEGLAKTFWDRVNNELSEYDRDLVLRKITNPDTGAIYSVPCVETSLIDKMKYRIWINQEWLDKLNLKAPTNNEELVEVLKAFRDKDPNGNGIKDEIPLFTPKNVSGGIDWLINLFVYYNEQRKFLVGDDGKLTHVQTTDEYREALKFIKMLSDEKLLTSLAWTATGSEAKQITTPSNGTALCGIFSAHLTTNCAMGNEVMYQYVPLKTWGSAVRLDTSCNQTTFITESCDNPERAFQMLMKMWSWDGSMRIRYGEKDVNWRLPDEGAKSDIGLDATYALISDPLTQQSTAKWAKIASTLNVYAEGETAQVAENMDEWTKKKSQLHAESYALFCESEEENNPKIICPTLVYTEEEKELTSMERTNTGDRMTRAMSEFCTGVLDPNKDSDWNAYLKEINDLGYPIWLELAQSTYDKQK